MYPRVAFLLAVLCAGPLWGQELKLPQGVKGEVGEFIIVRAETEDPVVKWFVADRGLNLFPQELQKDTKAAVIVALRPGVYRLLAVSAKDATPSDIQETSITVGDPPPDPVVPPVVVPPGPGPGPVVPPDPTPAGPRGITVIYETGATGEGVPAPEMAQWSATVNLLRRGPTADYLKSKGHQLLILDDDSLGADDKPSPLVEAWRPLFKDAKLPMVIIYDLQTRNIVHKQEVPYSAPLIAILDIIKAHGG